MKRRISSLLSIVTVGIAASCAAAGEVSWFRGSLHAHTLWSDGDDLTERVAAWYRDNGYHFLAISDHNVLAQRAKWLKVADLEKKHHDLPALILREKDRLKTRGNPADGTFEVCLRTVDEIRPLVEKPGQFILIDSEEISDTAGKVPIHINAANIAAAIRPQKGKTARECIENNLRAAAQQAKQAARPILAQVNHPNFNWAVSAEDLADLPLARFVEAFNAHPIVRQTGDRYRPAADRVWDIANTLRVSLHKLPPLYGVATDDAHHYHRRGPKDAAPGRAWVMVAAGKLSVEAIIAAMERGSFYASTGVTLRSITYAPAERMLTVEIEPDGDATFVTEFIGTMEDYQVPRPGPATRPVDRAGIVLARCEGLRATYRLTGAELFVRATVTSSAAPESTAYRGSRKQAWTQPVGWESRVRRDMAE